MRGMEDWDRGEGWKSGNIKVVSKNIQYRNLLFYKIPNVWMPSDSYRQ